MTQGKIIHVETLNGLCNRIRALISGICLAEEQGCNLRISWPADQYNCNATFSDLFERESLPNWVTVVDHRPKQEKVICLDKDQALKAIEAGNIIASYGFFHGEDFKRWRHHVRRLQPRYAIRQQVVRNFSSIPRSLSPVGVHIRRTDNLISARESPLWAFKLTMKKMRDSFFYLASDDTATAEEIQRVFPGRVYCNETIRNRHTLQGMQEAVASLYTLANCPIILCSAGSSFSSVASTIVSAKKHLITKNL